MLKHWKWAAPSALSSLSGSVALIWLAVAEGGTPAGSWLAIILATIAALSISYLSLCGTFNRSCREGVSPVIVATCLVWSLGMVGLLVLAVR